MKAVKETVNRYYKYVWGYFDDFNPPAPISTLGGDTFGVTGYTTGGDVQGSPQAACYPNTGYYYCYTKGGRPTTTFNLYNPRPLIIDGFIRHYAWSGTGTTDTLYGSNDGNNWTQIHSQYVAVGTQTVNFTNATPYQYYRLTSTCGGGGGADGGTWHSIRLLGKEYSRQAQEVTAEDEYDFIVEGGKYYVVKNTENDKYYAVKSYEKGQYYGN